MEWIENMSMCHLLCFLNLRVEADGVFGALVGKGSVVAGNKTRGNIVTDVSTEQETVRADNGIGGDGGTVEEVEAGTGEDVGLLEFDGSLGVSLAVSVIMIKKK
jgi:hypothetical protein